MSGPSSPGSPPPGESLSEQPLGPDLLRCPRCRLLLWEPVTASCGHSFCKPCLGGAGPSRCPLCQERLELPGTGEARCSVVLCGLLERCVPRERRLAGLAQRVRHRLARGDAREALRMAQRGVELALDCSSLRLCRAEALVALGQYPEALEDLDAVCRAEPGEHEAFFRKGKVLLEMGQRDKALLVWKHCLTLSPHFQPARREMEKIIKESDAPQPCTAAHLGDAPLSSAGSQVNGGSPALPSSIQTQDEEGELSDGRGDAGSEHSQDTATLSQPGPWQELETSAESRGQWLLDKEEETAAEKCPQPCLRESLSISDLECSLCIRMFFEPVTTPCGHTFCKECLERCLDHRPNCPLCKQSLREYLKAGRYSPTVLLQDIMLAAFPTQLAERRELHRAEMAELSNLTKNIPIFVCTMAFPGIPCPLHVFEPRYRLMIRRCQESGTRRFGMCIYENGKSFADYGCMLEIRQVEVLADGRSLVDTIGRQRFRVLSRGHRDGYHTADIEYLEDKKVSGEELQELQCLHESTYRLAQRFCEHGDLTSRHILMQHGPLPEKEEDIQDEQKKSLGEASQLFLLLSLSLTKNIPIFVCTMAFPGIPCPLHVFEPRYRLMIRRCQESGTRRFGMCIYENGKSFADYGCMLEIRQVEVLADGRSLVDTIGRQRFRVLSRGHRDGYHTADIEYLEDKKVSGEELQELQCLHESTYRLAQRFCEHGDLTSRHILMQHGPLPEKEEDIQASADGPTWCWWLVSILPLDPSYQLSLFSCTSLRARLSQLQHILTALLQQPPPRHLLPEHSPRGRV
ncbi:hypothetical protein HGM15179_004799 [Zosterops borbonicus]|uniref:LON peptidase N-terminal domain and ring finger 1 n=1 Tax=Zosterops borbonicus TaxID=364589 RepID=A0A8K1GN90_9PASS|nr:hypothetical protein HGM15179_004799 [Zosterops borbonicus]